MRSEKLPLPGSIGDDLAARLDSPDGEAGSVSFDAARLRPRFELDLPVPADEAMDRIREGLDTPVHRDTTMTVGRHAELQVAAHERRIWSPRLTIQVEDASGGSLLRGRFAPRPDVWTGFMFVYFLVVFLVLFGATLGWVQRASDETPWGFWAVPAGLAVIASIHGLSYMGQRLAAGQMRELRDQLDSVLSSLFDRGDAG